MPAAVSDFAERNDVVVAYRIGLTHPLNHGHVYAVRSWMILPEPRPRRLIAAVNARGPTHFDVGHHWVGQANLAEFRKIIGDGTLPTNRVREALALVSKVECPSFFLASQEHQCVRPVGFNQEVIREERVSAVGGRKRFSVFCANKAYHATPPSALAVSSPGLPSRFISTASSSAANASRSCSAST